MEVKVAGPAAKRPGLPPSSEMVFRDGSERTVREAAGTGASCPQIHHGNFSNHDVREESILGTAELMLRQSKETIVIHQSSHSRHEHRTSARQGKYGDGRKGRE